VGNDAHQPEVDAAEQVSRTKLSDAMNCGECHFDRTKFYYGSVYDLLHRKAKTSKALHCITVRTLKCTLLELMADL
jgi:nitrate/TMAO reductase-like tetraheme cytochrome c subunit